MNHNKIDYHRMNIRHINENTFEMMLNAESWNKVLIENDTNKVYSILGHFLELHDTCTKLTNTCKNRRYKKPWITKGLFNACKTKINL